MKFNSHNSDNIEIRPRFKLISTFSNETIIQKITETLPLQKKVEGVIKGTHAFLTVNNTDQHYWSPALEVIIEKYVGNKDKTLIRCLIGPRQTVWMILMFFLHRHWCSYIFWRNVRSC